VNPSQRFTTAMDHRRLAVALPRRQLDRASFAKPVSGTRAALFCIAHIPLALALNRYDSLPTLHALVVLGIGIWWALQGSRRLYHVALIGAYITGAEVLWRMNGAQVFWEFGKYSTAIIFLIAILRTGRLKGPALMFAYFALQVPSIAVIIGRLGPSDAQGYISFNLSGPFALMVAAWFFSHLRLTAAHLQRIFVAAVGPLIGIAAITFSAIHQAKHISFTDESNFVSSGGFGPNQVSAVLGLGALFALMFILFGKASQQLKILMIGAMCLMGAQSALTFSRGGLYSFAGSVVLASAYLLRDKRIRANLLLVASIVFVLGSYVILPRLESITGGALASRFSNTTTTNRVQIILDEMRVFREAPLLGVGPGGSRFAGVATAHTEFTRLVAEHGSLGIVALVLLLVATAQSIRRVKTARGKALAVSLVAWGFLFMLSAAMRLVAPAFTIGLAFATILPRGDAHIITQPRKDLRATGARRQQQPPTTDHE
jgi:O-Antigen ligase